MALRNGADACEVDDGVGVGAADNVVHGPRVPQVDAGLSARVRTPGAVYPQDFVARILEKPAQVGSDEAVRSDHQNAHWYEGRVSFRGGECPDPGGNHDQTHCQR